MGHFNKSQGTVLKTGTDPLTGNRINLWFWVEVMDQEGRSGFQYYSVGSQEVVPEKGLFFKKEALAYVCFDSITGLNPPDKEPSGGKMLHELFAGGY